MTDQELEQRLQRIDLSPVIAPVDPLDGLRARALMEHIMSTSRVETPLDAGRAAPRRRWPIMAAVAAAAALIVGVVIVAANRSTDTELVAATYALQGGDPLASCLPIADAPPPPDGAIAFAGTVSAVTATNVVLDVDRTYAGAESDVVTLATPSEVTNVALDGVALAIGERYLVTVVDGVVQICGASGPATPELEAVYTGWFAR